jgi:kynurenine formamidase
MIAGRSLVSSVLLIGMWTGVGCTNASRLPAGRWVDLTHEYSDQTLYWPTAEPFKLTREFKGTSEAGFYYEANRYSASEHGGTHADAPSHFSRNGRTMEQVPIERWIGPAVVIDVSADALKDRDYRVSTQDIARWESAHGRIPNDTIVFVRTGYAQYWPDAVRYLGTDEKGPGAIAKLHFPGLHPDAARWLAEERRIKAFGIDTASIDYGQSKQFEVHQILFPHDIPALENVANLDKLPPSGAIVFALPMKIKGGSGAPVRIAALLPQ